MLGSVEEIRSVAELEQVMSSVHLSFERNTSLEVFPSYEEKGNLFIVAVAPSETRPSHS